MFAPSQWETALLCNDVSHWLGTHLDSALIMQRGSIITYHACRTKHNIMYKTDTMFVGDLATRESGHQQSWYWLSYPVIFRSRHQKGYNLIYNLVSTYTEYDSMGFINDNLPLGGIMNMDQIVNESLSDYLNQRGPSMVRADSRLASSQWGPSLQSNAVSHWLGANLESALSKVT